ncbi:MAG: hypothetical protein ACE5FK_01680 [Candidatus Methylomirabilia bacterium]
MYLKSTIAVVTVLLLTAGVCEAQSFGTGLDEYFRLEWKVEDGKRGPVITGQIYNEHGMWATDVQLLVEQLNTSGDVIEKSIGYVDSWVPPGDRAYFWIPVPSVATYRVTVHSFGFTGGGPGA